jgi:hypothetical protein
MKRQPRKISTRARGSVKGRSATRRKADDRLNRVSAAKPRTGRNPFAAFSEWQGKADEKAYANL